jgi:hypothetical protein
MITFAIVTFGVAVYVAIVKFFPLPPKEHVPLEVPAPTRDFVRVWFDGKKNPFAPP